MKWWSWKHKIVQPIKTESSWGHHDKMTGINKQQTAHHDTHRAGHNEQGHEIF